MDIRNVRDAMKFLLVFCKSTHRVVKQALIKIAAAAYRGQLKWFPNSATGGTFSSLNR